MHYRCFRCYVSDGPLSRIVPPDAAEQAVAARKPGGNPDTALRALRAGLALAATPAHPERSGPPKAFSA